MSTPNGSEVRPCRICGHGVIGHVRDASSFVHSFCANPTAPTPALDVAAIKRELNLDAWDAWQRGLAEAKRQMASVELKSHEDNWDWPARISIDRPSFCLVTNCGLTVTAGSDNCWRHSQPEDPQ